MELPHALDTEFPEPSTARRAEAEARQAALTKPPGSLGRLETLAIELASWQDAPLPQSRPAAALLFAADHPVTAHGVSVYPSAVTAAMVANFLHGGAAASVLARSLELPLTVVDVGVEASYSVPKPGAARLVRAPRDGRVGDLVHEDGMSTAAFEAALQAGRDAIDALPSTTRLVLLGEMGIGNTTVASALAAGLTGGPTEDWVGPGTGATGGVLAQKRAVVRDAVRRVGRVDPGECLRRLGGRELAALVGATARAAARRMTVLVDGFIVSTAVLALVRMRPRVRPALVFAHRSAEPGHRHLLNALDAQPLLDLELRLGEGSGSLMALPFVDLACRLHRDMATFEAAAVPGRIE